MPLAGLPHANKYDRKDSPAEKGNARENMGNMYEMKGLDGSNPPLSANQSLDLPYILEKPETSREMRRSFYPQRTRESHLTPNSPDSASILSVRNKNGSLQRPRYALDGVSPTIAIPGDRPPSFGLTVREQPTSDRHS